MVVGSTTFCFHIRFALIVLAREAIRYKRVSFYKTRQEIIMSVLSKNSKLKLLNSAITSMKWYIKISEQTYYYLLCSCEYLT